MPLPPRHVKKHVPRDWRAHIYGLRQHYPALSNHELANRIDHPRRTVDTILRGGIKPPRKDNPLPLLSEEHSLLISTIALDNPANRDRSFQSIA